MDHKYEDEVKTRKSSCLHNYVTSSTEIDVVNEARRNVKEDVLYCLRAFIAAGCELRTAKLKRRRDKTLGYSGPVARLMGFGSKRDSPSLSAHLRASTFDL